MFLSLLASLFTAPAVANTPGVACEFYTLAQPGCGPDRKQNVANCVVVKNPTKHYAELGIKGICPVGSGAQVTRPSMSELPLFIDATPADPTTGGRNVVAPKNDAYIFLRPLAGDPDWKPPQVIDVEAKLYDLVPVGIVTNAQFVPAYTAVASPQSGVSGAGYFCQPLDLSGPYNYATIRRDDLCD